MLSEAARLRKRRSDGTIGRDRQWCGVAYTLQMRCGRSEPAHETHQQSVRSWNAISSDFQ